MQDDPNLWRTIVGARAPEVWAGIMAGMIYVYVKSPHPTWTMRVFEAIISGLIAYATSDWAAERVGVPLPVAAALLAACGYLILDVVRSLIADRQILKDIIVKRLGGKNG